MDTERIKPYVEITFDLLIILELILIVVSLPIPEIHLLDYTGFVRNFDLTICFLLILEFFYGLYIADNKKEFTKEHIWSLIAAIPFDLLPIHSLFNLTRFLRLIRIIRLIMAVNIIKKYNLEKFVKRTSLFRILSIIFGIIIFFTVLLYFAGIKNLTDSFYFVIITLTTVGYNDNAINTPLTRFISVFLIILGVLVFSTITGIIASFFTDRLIDDGISVDENLQFINQKLNFQEKELEKTRKELEEVKEKLDKSNEHSKQLKEQLSQLNELLNYMNKKDDN